MSVMLRGLPPQLFREYIPKSLSHGIADASRMIGDGTLSVLQSIGG
jgi:hypothetical protein